MRDEFVLSKETRFLATATDIFLESLKPDGLFDNAADPARGRPPRTGFRFIRGVWLYLPTEKAVFVHLENNGNPSRLHWSAIWTQEPIVTLKNTQDASVRGLTLAHGAIKMRGNPVSGM
jgi:hypothetical protein